VASVTNANVPDNVITFSRGFTLLAFRLVPVFLPRELLAIGTLTAALS
jgi:hypothetical protein